ncbi:MAG: hypothetical protein AMXMBFR57_24010 [Acidimicrobiia bacterium]
MITDPVRDNALPAWSRFVLAMMPLGMRRAEILADFTEVFADRRGLYGRAYAHRRLLLDIVSLWRTAPLGGHLWRDLRFGIRLWRRHPGPVGIAVVGLGLAIGLVTTAFSLLNATRLRPYGMDDPGSVVQITTTAFAHDYSPTWSYARFLAMHDARSLAALGASVTDTARISRRADDDSVVASPLTFVSSGYLPMLGGRAVVGRTLMPTDHQPDAPAVVVLSHRLWTTQFSADPDVIGTTAWIDGAPATIVGVMRADFTVPDYRQAHAWAPFAAFDDLLKVAQTYVANGRIPASRLGEAFGPTSRTDVNVLARLAPGVSRAAAEQELSVLVNAPLPGQAPDPARQALPVRVFSATTPMDGPDAAESWLELASLLGVVGLVLIVAFANAANLLMASTATRAREIGVRLALGATRRRLWMQMVAESLLLGLSASAIGLLMAAWLAPSMAGLLAVDPGVDVMPDGRVFLFAIGVAVCCSFIAAVGASRFGASGHVWLAIQAQGTFALPAKASSRTRSSFVGVQAAVSMLLLVSAALLGRSAVRSASTDVGFDADRTLAVEVTTPEVGLDEATYFRRAIDLLSASPGIDAVGLIARRPFGFSRSTLTAPGDSFQIVSQHVDAGFFRAAGIRLLRGRLFDDAEVRGSQPVALISETVARQVFGSVDPLGRSLSEVVPSRKVEPAVIIGVVADVTLHRQHSHYAGIVFRPLPIADNAGTRRENPPVLIVRAANPASHARAVEQALRGLDPRVRPSAAPLARDLHDADQRAVAWMAAPVALLSLVLSALGIFGVTSFVMRRRLAEMSIRMVLGATTADVSRLLLRDSLRPVLIGLAIGLCASLGAAKVLASALPGISPFDPPSYAVAILLLTGASLLAVIRPVRTTTRVSPAGILRHG